MSKFYVITATGYREEQRPPHHDHWMYDEKTDSYYELYPNCVEKKERTENDN